MPTIENAKIKKHDTFRFVTYNFQELNIEIKKSDLLIFLKLLYKELTSIEVVDRKEEMKQFKGNEIQYVLFYGDFPKREGFEYIYNSKDSTPETTSSFYMFEQTIAENFHIYFSLSDKNELLKPKRQDHIIEEIVVYMAQFLNEDEKKYENLFNNALKSIDKFINEKSI